MKAILLPTILSLFIVSVSANANSASIRCSANNGSSIAVYDGGDVEEFYLNCQTELFEGNVCFQGKRSEAIEVLQYMSTMDVLGDEYRIINAWFVGNDKIKYEVFDGPNETVSSKNIISKCK